jgi:hypothetical protein
MNCCLQKMTFTVLLHCFSLLKVSELRHYFVNQTEHFNVFVAQNSMLEKEKCALMVLQSSREIQFELGSF